jgi:hypothetical protein
MITEQKYKELLSKLDIIIDTESVHGSVSPTSEKSGAGLATPDKIFLSPETEFEKLSEQKVLLAHALLHQFYASGGVNNLTRTDIEQLHNKVKEKIKNHSNFDRLDEI